LDAGDVVNALSFSPNHYWLSAATDSSIKVWALEGKTIVCELNAKTHPEFFSDKSSSNPNANPVTPPCTSLAWSADGSHLYAGYTDGVIRVWEVKRS